MNDESKTVLEIQIIKEREDRILETSNKRLTRAAACMRMVQVAVSKFGQVYEPVYA